MKKPKSMPKIKPKLTKTEFMKGNYSFLSRLSGIPVSSWQRYLTRKASPNITTMIQAADSMGIPPTTLIEWYLERIQN